MAKHGYYHHPLYKVWHSMKQRCTNPNNPNYHQYGGAGVTVCAEWLNSPANFVEWGLANGWNKELQIDKDILSEKLGVSPSCYSESTCQFIDKATNISHASRRSSKSTNRKIKMDWDDIERAKQLRTEGKKLKEIAVIFNVSVSLISVNLKKT